MDMNNIHINHQGNSLRYEMVLHKDGVIVTELMTGHDLYKHAKELVKEHQEVVITANRGATLSGVLKHISSILAFGEILPHVHFKLVEEERHAA